MEGKIEIEMSNEVNNLLHNILYLLESAQPGFAENEPIE